MKVVSMTKKTFSSILVSVGGFIMWAGWLSFLLRSMVNAPPEFGATFIMTAMGVGCIWGGAALWFRWKLPFGIFLTVIGALFGSMYFFPMPQSASNLATKNAGAILGVLSLICGVLFIINSNRNRESSLAPDAG